MYLISYIFQIIAESLPISSSGHAQILGLQMPDYLDRLALGPTIIMLLLYFYKDIFSVVRDIKHQWRIVCAWGVLIVMATSVTVFCYELIDQLLSAQGILFPLWVGFGITALCLLSLKWCLYNNENQPRFFKLFLIGTAQGVARLPGVSRLGITYTIACWLGYAPKVAFRISSALQLPLFSAGFLEGLIKVWRRGGVDGFFTPAVLLCTLGALVIAYLLLWVVEIGMVNRKIGYVGWYMLVVMVIAFFLDNLEFFRPLLVGL